ncbi:MAG TPA: exodeoxyribonuclease VII large subunit [Anaerolineales bacterium]|nr:exodeoxyribonuclease VII large subunit [Anaerolineales bacterium]
MNLFQTPLWPVAQLTQYLRNLLESDDNLQDLWVQGEVSNFSRPASGHIYFTLKDSQAALRCVMWRNTAARQVFLPREGDAIEVHGSINIYEASGQYQLYADQIRPAGEGALYQAFLRLKTRLEDEGLFAPERKRPIPRWPRRIGIITSPTGAALRDMLNTIQRRYCLAEVFLAPTAVQGEEAPLGIVAALESLNRVIQPDVILLARGGGSIEDLWAFNDERVARAIVASLAPVISGVGHETDFTITDFVSDLRAATPTAAAELATPDRAELQPILAETVQRLARAGQQSLSTLRWSLNHTENAMLLRSPRARIRTGRQRLDDLERQAGTALAHAFKLRAARLDGLSRRLETLNPREALKRGYAIVSTPDGQIVKHVAQAHPGQVLNIRVMDGLFYARSLATPDEERS